jgi:hypothetical protein
MGKKMKKEATVDLWTLVHIVAGFVLLLGAKYVLNLNASLATITSFLILLIWEGVEYVHTPEYYTVNLDNNIVDVVADLIGITLALMIQK